MEMFEPIVKSESKWNTQGRNVILNLSKKDKEKDTDEWWPRLQKEKVKNQLITIDWAKWIDPDASDEDDKPAAAGMGDFDPNQMQDFNMGGGMEDDSDDEEEEAQVEPHKPSANLDDLDGEQEDQNMQKSPEKEDAKH